MGRSGPLPVVGVRLVAQDYRQFTDALRRADRVLENFSNTARKPINVNVSTGDAQQQLQQLQRTAQTAGDKTGKAFGGATRNSTRQELTGLEKVMNGVMTGIGASVGFTIAGSVASGITKGAGLITGALSNAIDLQQLVTDTAAISGQDIIDPAIFEQTRDDISALLQDVATSDTLQVGLTGANAAFQGLLKTGTDYQDILNGVLEETIAFANANSQGVASLNDMNDAATVTGRGMAIFGLSAQQAEAFTNSMTAVIQNSTIRNIHDLDFALINSATAVQALGIDHEELAATLIATAKSFSGGREQGTSYEYFLKALAGPTKEQADAQKALNLALIDADGNFVGVASASRQLNAALDGLPPAERFERLTAAFGAQGAAIAGSLADNVDGVANAFDKVESTSARAISAVKTETVAAKLANLSDQADALGTSFFSAFVENLQPGIESASGLVGSLDDDFSSLGKTIADFLNPAITGFADAVIGIQLSTGNGNIGTAEAQADSLVQYFTDQRQKLLDLAQEDQGGFDLLGFFGLGGGQDQAQQRPTYQQPIDELTALGGDGPVVSGGNELFRSQIAEYDQAIQEAQQFAEAITLSNRAVELGVPGAVEYQKALTDLAASTADLNGVTPEELAQIPKIYDELTESVGRAEKAFASADERAKNAGAFDNLAERGRSQIQGRINLSVPDIGVDEASKQYEAAIAVYEAGLADFKSKVEASGGVVTPQLEFEFSGLVQNALDSINTAVAEIVPEPIDVPVTLNQSLDQVTGLPAELAAQYQEQANALISLSEAYRQNGELNVQQQAQLQEISGITAVLSGNLYGLADANALVANSEALVGQGADVLISGITEVTGQYEAGIIGAGEYIVAIDQLIAALVQAARTAGLTDAQIGTLVGNLRAGVQGVRQQAVTDGTTPTATDVNQGNIRANERLVRFQQRQAKLMADAQGRAAKAGAGAIKNVESVLGDIEGLFKLSKVTQEDLLAAEQGRYVDKADEFVRQLEDFVVNGNQEFAGRLDEAKVALQRVGVTADNPEEVLAKIKDGWANQWLFAAKENVTLINRVAVESAAELKRKSEEGRQNIIEAFGGIVDANVEAIQKGLGGGGGTVGASAGVPDQAELDESITALDFTYIEDVIANSLATAIATGFAGVDLGEALAGSLTAGGGDGTALDVMDYFSFPIPDSKIPLAVYDYWQIAGTDAKQSINLDLSQAIGFTGAAGAARIDLSRAINFTGTAGSESIDLGTLIDFTGTLPKEQVDREELIEFINAVPTEQVDRQNVLNFINAVPTEQVDRQETVDFINAVPTEDVDRQALISFINSVPTEDIDRQTLIDYINELPVEDVDRQALITFANALPTEEVNRQALINYINAVPTEQIDRNTLIGFVNELPTEQVDRQGLIGFINELPSEQVERDKLITYINSLPTETINRQDLVIFTGTAPTTTIDVGKLVNFSGDPKVTQPISTSGTAGATTVDFGNDPIKVEVINPNDPNFTGDERFALEDVQATGNTTITGPVTFPDNEAQRDVIRENERLVELAGDILENWDETVTKQATITNAANSGASGALIGANTEAEIAKLQKLGNEASTTGTDVDTLGTASTEAAEEITNASEDTANALDDMAETSGNVIEELRGWEGALNTSTTKLTDFATALDSDGVKKALDNLENAIEGAADRLAKIGSESGGGGGGSGNDPAPTGNNSANLLGGRVSGRSLVGEDGPELWFNPFARESGIVGRNGAQILDFPPGSYIVPAEETARILARSGGEAKPDFMSFAFGDGGFGSFPGTGDLFPGGLKIPKSNSRSPNLASDRFQTEDQLLRELYQQVDAVSGAVAGLYDQAGLAGAGAFSSQNAYSRGGGRNIADVFARGANFGVKPASTVINITNNIDNSVNTSNVNNNYALTTRSLRSSENVETDFRILRNGAR